VVVKNPHASVRRGDIVRVRGERWRVSDVRSTSDGHQTLALVGAGASNASTSFSVITPFDQVHVFACEPRPRIVTLRRWRHACREVLDEGTRCGSAASLKSAARARIALHAYQLEPALAMVRGRSSRVLIADEVGLGKTIQAGLIVSELRARHAADRVLVLAPAGLCTQWAHELEDRFDIQAVIVDTQAGRRRAACLPAGLNPWVTMPIAVSSIDYVKRSEVLPLVCAARWDAVVVDEAHGVTPGSDRSRAVATICRQAAYVVLLTATPHNGDASAFHALCALGAAGDDDPLLIFSRTRREVAIGRGRRVHRLYVTPTGRERRMYDALADLERAARAEKAAGAEAQLMLSVLNKRACSSAYSLSESVSRRLASLGNSEAARSVQMLLPLDESGVEADAAPDCSAPLLSDEGRERMLLAAVLAGSMAAVGDQRKVATLRRLLARLDARGERAIVFTEYRDTLLHVRAQLNRPVAVVHGGLSLDERHAALADFRHGAATVLFATDAASEGLNLHHACRVVINLELPWNPMRLEQRIGRVDRIGQGRRVHVFHLIARATSELAVLERLEERLTKADIDIRVGDPLGLPRFDREARDPITGVRLIEESLAEHARLQHTRAMPSRPASDSISRDVVAAFVRGRRRLRTALLGRSLAVTRASLENRAGQAAAVHVSAILFESAERPARFRRHVSDAFRSIALLPSEAIDPELCAWKDDVERVHTAFWARRVEREQAVASMAASVQAPVQAGLFDRRAEKEAAATVTAHRTREAEAAERIGEARRAMTLELDRPQAVLLLLN
jgi:superfamily II DNA or RNA helicase